MRLSFRKLFLHGVTFVCVSIGSAASWALGLGELQHDTHLGQVFRAEILLVDAEALFPNKVQVRILGEQETQALGFGTLAGGLSYLMDIELVENRQRQPVIKIVSKRPISEPYLNFVVQVQGPTGSVNREYSVLLNTPVSRRLENS